MLSATIICGNPGAGKSAFVRHVIHDDSCAKSLWLTHDLRTLNIDACSLPPVAASGQDRGLLQLRNGNSLAFSADVLRERLTQLHEEGVRHVFLVCEDEAHDVLDRLTLQDDGVVTVNRMILLINTPEYFRQLQQARPGDSETLGTVPRGLTEFLIPRCQAILLNKRDLVTREEAEFVRNQVRSLNPDAVIEETRFGRTDGERLLKITPPVFDCGRFLKDLSRP